MVFVIISSFCWLFLDVFRKIAARNFSPIEVSISMSLGLTLLFGLLTLFTGKFEFSQSLFWCAFFANIIGFSANYLISWSLGVGNLSMVVPLFSLTSLWATLLEFQLGKVPTSQELIAMACILMGGLFLFYEGFVEKGNAKRVLFPMLIVGILLGGATFMDRKGVELSSPIEWGLSVTSLGLVMQLIIFNKFVFPLFKTHRALKPLFLVVIAMCGALFFQLYALENTPSGVLETVKRGIYLSGGILIGKFFFKETISHRKMIAVGLMIIGVLIA